MHLAVNQQRQTFLKAHGAQPALAELLLQRLGQPFELQAAQLIQGRMHHHVVLSFALLPWVHW